MPPAATDQPDGHAFCRDLRYIGTGKFYIQGLVDNRRFDDLIDAERHARQSLVAAVRNMAQMACTTQTRVTITTKDLLGKTALGEEIFLGRGLVARLQGRPDLVH
jgi:hypothetical protein